MSLLIIFIIVPMLSLFAQDENGIEHIAKLMAVEPEDLDEDEVERLSVILKRPILLNIADKDELGSYGIFSKYQIASLLDYRERSGPCLSFMELTLLDGFGVDFVDRIRPFVSLETLPDIGHRISHEITMRTSARYSPGSLRYGYTSRYKLKVGEHITTSIACSRSLDAEQVRPDAICAGMQVRMRRYPLSLTIGDFNTRFGQGLAMWSGSDFATLTTPSAFMKRSFGVTASTSFTGNNVMTGMSAEYSQGNWECSLIAAVPGVKSIKESPDKLRILPACNLTYGWRNGQAGLTHYAEFAGLACQAYIPAMKTACDMAMCVGGVDYFGELMFDWIESRPSVIVGTIAPVGDGGSVAAMLRALNKEYTAAASGSVKKQRMNASASVDVTLYKVPKKDNQERSSQLKFHSQWQYSFSDPWSIKVRLTERIRTWGKKFRTDFRTDLLWQSGCFSMTCRINILHSNSIAALTYVEGGCKNQKISVYLRQGLFCVDNWDDRIYAYERDVPGAYNSPAFYGRGVWTSLMTSWKPSTWCRLYLRAGLTLYPFMIEKKPGKAELRIQSVFDF